MPKTQLMLPATGVWISRDQTSSQEVGAAAIDPKNKKKKNKPLQYAFSTQIIVNTV